MDAREQRGLQFADTARISRKKSGAWSVLSQNGGGCYSVSLDGNPHLAPARTTNSGTRSVSASSPLSTRSSGKPRPITPTSSKNRQSSRRTTWCISRLSKRSVSRLHNRWSDSPEFRTTHEKWSQPERSSTRRPPEVNSGAPEAVTSPTTVRGTATLRARLSMTCGGAARSSS